MTVAVASLALCLPDLVMARPCHGSPDGHTDSVANWYAKRKSKWTAHGGSYGDAHGGTNVGKSQLRSCCSG